MLTNLLELSFIIPIYNGELYLFRCLDSLLNQGISYDKYEIICINDCSIDNSINVILNYQKKYSNIILIDLPVNSKTGTVCNIGLTNARGKYVWIVGQDDWIESYCLQKLIPLCDKNELDVISFNYRRVDELENELHSATVFTDSKVMNGNAYIKEYFGNNFEHYLLGYEWRAIYNNNYLKTKAISFTNGAIYEDTTFLFQALLFGDRVSSICDFIYYYRVNLSSITDFSKKFRGDLIYEFAFVAGNEVLELSKNLKDGHKEFSVALYKKAIWYFESFSYKVVATTYKEKRVFYSLLSKNKKTNKDLIVLTSWYIRLLSLPHIGFLCSIVLRPFYQLKRLIKYKNKTQESWCY